MFGRSEIACVWYVGRCLRVALTHDGGWPLACNDNWHDKPSAACPNLGLNPGRRRLSACVGNDTSAATSNLAFAVGLSTFHLEG
jgi:hypothetical protein